MSLIPLLYYAAEGTSNEFEKLVKESIKAQKSFLDEKDEKGRNVLFHAAMTDNVKNFQYVYEKAALSSSAILQMVDNNNATVLHWAVQFSASKVVKDLISIFADSPSSIILARDNDLVTPLHIAATKSNTKFLKLFIENLKHADNVFDIAKDKRQRSPLHYAASKVNIDAIRLMIDSDINQPGGPILGFPIDHRDKNGNTPIMCSVGLNFPQSVQVVKYLAKKKPVSTTRQNKDGMTVLHIAVAARNLEVVKFLIEESYCQVDIVDNEQRTPLHYAAEHGYCEIVEYLLNKEARNSTRDKFGVTPAHYAAQFSAECLKLIFSMTNTSEVRDNENRSCLMWAVCGGNIEAINYLIQRENAPDRRATDKNGYSALHLAAMVGNEKICKILINQGWNISERDNQGNTALHLAAGRGHTDVLRCLVASGAHMRDRDTIERTPVFWACLGGQSHTLHCMIRELSFEWRTPGTSDSRPITDALDRTLLHASAYAGSSACINVLLSIEQEDNFLVSPLVGYKDQDRKTALHEACIAGKIDCVLSLLKSGSALNSVDTFRKTPLDYANDNNHKMLSEHLRSLDAMTYDRLARAAVRIIETYYLAKKARRSQKM